jgi:hypothetical protein
MECASIRTKLALKLPKPETRLDVIPRLLKQGYKSLPVDHDPTYQYTHAKEAADVGRLNPIHWSP